MVGLVTEATAIRWDVGGKPHCVIVVVGVVRPRSS
jgi:hypothetical protein